MANKKIAEKTIKRVLSLIAAICVASAGVSTAAFAAGFTYDKYIELGAEEFDGAVVHKTQADGKKGNVGAFDETKESGKSRISYNHGNRVEMTIAEETIQGKKNKYLNMNKTTSGTAYAYALFYPIDTNTAFAEGDASAVDDNEYIVRFRVKLDITGGSLDFTCGALYKIDYQRNIKIGNTSTGESINEGGWNDIEIKINKTQAKSWLTVNEELLSESEGDDISAFAHNYIKFTMGNSCSGEIELDDFAVSGVFVQDGTETVANEPVAVNFKDVSAGGAEAGSANEPMTFKLNATAMSGISSVAAYADGVSLNIVPTGDVTESLVDMGEHYAMCSANTYSVTVPAELITESPEITAQLTSTEGNTAETSFRINYRPQLTKDLVALQNFESIDVDDEGNGIEAIAYRGYVGTTALPESGYGKSLLVSNQYTSSNAGNDEQAPRVRLQPVADSSFAGKFVFETKVNVIAGDSGGQATLRLYGDSGGTLKNTELIKFLGATGNNADKMKVGSSTYADCKNGELNDDGTVKTLGDWISIKLEIDTPNNLCTVYTSDENGTLVQRGDAIEMASFDNVEYVQLQITKTANTNAIAIDDMRMYISEKRPVIEPVNEAEIKTEDKFVLAEIDGTLNPESITVSKTLEDGSRVDGTVKLFDNGSGREIPLESAGYEGGKLTVYPTRKLMSGKSYKIVIAGGDNGAEVLKGLRLDENIETVFNVPREKIFVDNVTYGSENVEGTLMKTSSVELSNHLGVNKTVYVVMTARKDGEQIDFAAQAVNVSPSGATATPKVKEEAGATYEVYVYELDTVKKMIKYIGNRLFSGN